MKDEDNRWRIVEVGVMGSAAAVAKEFEGREEESEETGWDASHGDDEGHPAGVGSRALRGDSSEGDEDECGCEGSDAEDEEAGAEEFAGVRLHKGGE